MRLLSPAPECTREVGRRLARASGEGGLVVALIGALGAGKSELVRGVAEGKGVDPGSVSSPTFTLVNQYDCPSGPPVVHVDFYRLEAEEELEGIGYYDHLAPSQMVAIEWADRFPASLPADRLELRLARLPEAEEEKAECASERREIEVAALGPRSQEVLALWREALSTVEALELTEESG